MKLMTLRSRLVSAQGGSRVELGRIDEAGRWCRCRMAAWEGEDDNMRLGWRQRLWRLQRQRWWLWRRLWERQHVSVAVAAAAAAAVGFFSRPFTRGH